MRLLVELKKMDERCTLIKGDDTKVFSMSLVVGIRCYFGMAFGLGGPMLHTGIYLENQALFGPSLFAVRKCRYSK